MCKEIGLEFGELPHVGKSKPHKHYTKYYDSQTRDTIQEIYRDDIDYFGYKFGD